MQISFILCLKLRDDGENHSFGLSALQHSSYTYLAIFLSLSLQWYIRTSPLFLVFQSHLSQRCSQLMTSPLSSQANQSIGNFLNLPSPDHHGDLYLHPRPSCVLSLLLILPLHSQTSQTDVHMFSLHLRNCCLILDPFQTAFCPLCDTSTALAELMKDHLVGILQSSSYSLANSSSAWASNGGDLQIIPWLPLFPALQSELSS